MDQLVTREGDLFQVSDQRGDFGPDHAASGLFARDTRFLSRFEVLVNGEKPHLLTASAADNYIQRVFAQAALWTGPHIAVGIQRRRVLYGGALYERISATSYERRSVAAQLELRFGADFGDLFEVRGAIRKARGEHLPARVEANGAILGYRGLDGVLRQTELRFSVTPAEIAADRALWQISLPPRGTAVIDVAVLPAENGAFPTPVRYEEALAALVASYAQWRQQCTVIESDNELLNRVLERSVLDVRVLRADLGHGPFVVAGIPWFAVPFGRDSLIVAAQALTLHPELARGTLRTMAALQGREVNAWRQEEPGKILHEMRRGEMANLDEVPFGRYYGSVDSTPLYLVLLCEYYAWTGDLELVRELLPNVRAALSWLDTYGDSDGDGFLEYRADPGKGLVVQSWKDSPSSMSHRDGHPAVSPVAVSEVQGYAYDARRRLAPILAELGETELSQRLIKDAEAVKIRFNDAFWMEDRQYLAIALDGTKAQVGTVASDAGQCLWSGIVDAPKAVHVARRLVAPDLFTGWGIRTLSTDEATYNPMSYHNGSVWPHDNSLCVLGLKRYGYDREANIVATGLLEAAVHFASFRLPELFCGYSREEGIPVAYPVACAPQAWAAAAPIALVQAMLGLSPDAAAGLLRLRPSLPDWVGRLALRGLRVGSAILDVEVTREGTRATVRDGQLDVVVE
ncbi:MAG TPA: amylo-alpha-1,6-glucosidase [Chloroflexota bacterium]|nr:amylo-alpha-1,6-glucosidase [Chloroflexota bacterium]